MNITVINLNQQARFMSRHNLYVIDVDKDKNCYNCGSFGHIMRNCKSQNIVKRGRKLEYRENENNRQKMIENKQNSNREESLIISD